MKLPLYIVYYLVLTGIVVSQAIYTIHQGGLLVNHAGAVRQLQAQKLQLIKEQQSLKTQLGRSTALISIASATELEAYQPISKPLVLKSSTIVAASSW